MCLATGRRDAHAVCVLFVADGPEISRADAQVAEEPVNDELDRRFFHDRYEKATEAESIYMATIADLGDGTHASSEIAAHIGMKQKDLSVRRDVLHRQRVPCGPANLPGPAPRPGSDADRAKGPIIVLIWWSISTIQRFVSSMQSFLDLDATFHGQPRELGPVLARIDTGRGRQDLFEEQVPQVVRQLSENARIASIKASNAIEGVVVDSDRALKIAEGAPRFRNRNEQEFAGYRDAIDGLMRLDSYEPLSVPFVLHLHRQLFEYAGGRGGYLKTDVNFIVSYESASARLSSPRRLRRKPNSSSGRPSSATTRRSATALATRSSSSAP